jgi:hypothetical protein
MALRNAPQRGRYFFFAAGFLAAAFAGAFAAALAGAAFAAALAGALAAGFLAGAFMGRFLQVEVPLTNPLAVDVGAVEC